MARGQIGDAGGGADTIAWSATGLAEADAARDYKGQLVYPNGFAAATGSPAWWSRSSRRRWCTTSRRCFLVVRDDVAVDVCRDWHFHMDALSLRVKGRFAAAIPDPNKAIRKLEIGARAATAGTARHTSKA